MVGLGVGMVFWSYIAIIGTAFAIFCLAFATAVAARGSQGGAAVGASLIGLAGLGAVVIALLVQFVGFILYCTAPVGYLRVLAIVHIVCQGLAFIISIGVGILNASMQGTGGQAEVAWITLPLQLGQGVLGLAGFVTVFLFYRGTSLEMGNYSLASQFTGLLVAYVVAAFLGIGIVVGLGFASLTTVGPKNQADVEAFGCMMVVGVCVLGLLFLGLFIYYLTLLARLRQAIKNRTEYGVGYRY